MPRTLGDAFVRVRPDTSRFNSEASSGLSKGLKLVAAGVAAAFASREAIRGINSLVARASDLSETGNKISVVFGKTAAPQVQKFAKGSVDALGQTQQSALNAAATFGVFGKAAGLTGKENAKFSTGLVKLSSDMASFSNTSPEQAIEAIGAALRGEAEPIRQYGVLLDDATLRNRALKLGLIDSVKTALTPANKVLAAQAEIMIQTKDAQGDFARTSGGLANQQRIAAAQTETLKTKLGQGLLPLYTAGANLLTTKVLPPLILFADKWVPKASEALAGWIDNADPSAMFERIGGALGSVNWNMVATQIQTLVAAGREMSPQFRDAAASLPQLKDVLNVTGVVLKFAADNVDLLAKALPYLVAGFVALKVTQAAFNVVALASPAIRLFEIVTIRAQTKALRAQTSALGGATIAQVVSGTATTATTKLTIKQRLAQLASAAASKAVAAATVAWTGVQWLLNAALTANPIGIVIVVIGALVAAFILAYKNSETFRKIVQNAWAKVQESAGRSWDFLSGVFSKLGSALASVRGAFSNTRSAVSGAWDSIKSKSRDAMQWVGNQMLGFAENILSLAVKAFGWAPKIGGPLRDALGKVRGFRDDFNKNMDGLRDENVKVRVSAGVDTGPGGFTLRNGVRIFKRDGGAITGPGGSRDDRIPAMLSNGEYVIDAKRVRKAGGFGFFDALRTAIDRGETGRGDLPAFAKGGPVVDATRPNMSGVYSTVRRFNSGVALSLAKATGKALLEHVKRMLAGLGSKGKLTLAQVARGQAAAKRWAGLPYLWAGISPTRGMDCSGAVAAVLDAALGRKLGRDGGTGSMPWRGWKPGVGRFTAGYFKGSPGHTAGNIGGLNFESRGGDGFVVGSRARSPMSSMFTNRMHYDRGGVAVGQGLLSKRTLRPERVLDPRTTVAFEELVEMLKGGLTGGGSAGRVVERLLERIAEAIENGESMVMLDGDVIADAVTRRQRAASRGQRLAAGTAGWA